MNKIVVMGLGPGHKKYTLPIVYDKANLCDIIIGGKRNLQNFYHLQNKEFIEISNNLDVIVEKIKKEKDLNKIGIVVSGDPCFYSFLSMLKRNFKSNELEVIPGISSLQYLFAKGVLTWQDGYMTSVHGREKDLLNLVNKFNKIALLTDTKNTPKVISRKLLENGIRDKKILIGENLSYENENIFKCTIEECIKIETDKLCVMIIYNEE